MRLVFLLSVALATNAPAFADTPIPGASQWMLVNDPAGCWAENNGDVHVKILANKSGHLVLAAARQDWHSGTDAIDFTLQVDAAAPVAMHGTMLTTIVMVGIDDAAMQDRIFKASSLTWHMPWGDFTAQVAGLGKAFAAVAECQHHHTQT